MKRSRRIYSEKDRARVYLVLESNEGNVKRTAREVNIPENTLRDWNRDWKANGIPEGFFNHAEEVQGEFVEQAEEVKFLALQRMREVIPDSNNLQHLATTVGILDDKITRAKGLPTSTVKTQNDVLDNPEHVVEIFKGFIGEIVAAARERHDVIDAEFTEQSPRELVKETH